MTTADHAHPVASSDTEETAYVPQSAPPPPSALIKLSSASDVYRNLANIRTKDREHFVVFFLNVRHRVIRRRTVAIGTLTGVDCHPREIFKPAIACSAAAIIAAHNHPSNVMWTTRLCGRTEASPTGSRPAYLPIIVAVREMQLDGRRPSEALQKRK